MKITLTYAIAVSAIAALVPAAHAVDSATSRQLKAEYVKYMKAVRAKDLPAIERMMAPDFKMSMGGQTCDRKTSIAMMKEHLKSVKSYDRWKYRFGPMTRRGNIATGIVHEETACTVMGKDGKLHKMTDKATAKSTFRRMGGAWKIVSVKSISDKMTMDGKPYDPMADMKMQKGTGHKMKHDGM